jgi:uncharacterized protein
VEVHDGKSRSGSLVSGWPVTASGYASGDYVRRTVDDELDELFGQLPAILLDGPKGVGKTRTATERAGSIRSLDDAATREIISGDPTIIADDRPPLLIDEWQRLPSIFDTVRRLVDADPSGGRFLLTGSALSPGPTHSGAGRITTVRMRPLALHERLDLEPTVSFSELLEGRPKVSGKSEFALRDYAAEIVAGGFPGMRRLTGRALTHQLDSYIDRIVDRDLPELGFNVRYPTTVRSWLRAYAAAVSTTTSWEKIRHAATGAADSPPSRTATQPYIELLTRLRVLEPLEAWRPGHNHLAAITQSPKHHLADPALAARLVSMSAPHLEAGQAPTAEIPRDGTYLGALFESLAALSLRVLAQHCDARVYHLRTRAGRHELDFIVETSDGRIAAFETKLSRTVHTSDVRHLSWLRDEIGDAFVAGGVLTTGPEAYRRPDGFAVIPLALLKP